MLVGQRGRHVPAQRDLARDPPPTGTVDHRRDGARARRRVHEVGAVPVPRVAAGRDGGADAGQRLPALGDDGEGRRVTSSPGSRRCSRRRRCGGRSCSSSAACTMVFGGLRALRQHDLKLLLALRHGQPARLLMVLFGAGTPAATTAGWVLLVAHAAFKARAVHGRRHHRPPDRARATSGGCPPLGAGGGGSRSSALAGRRRRWPACRSAPGSSPRSSPTTRSPTAAFGGHWLVLAVVVAGSMLTVAYAARFYWGAFVAPRRRAGEAAPTRRSPAPPSLAFVRAGGAAAPSGASVLGVAAGLEDSLASASLDAAVRPARTSVHLALWHGFGPRRSRCRCSRSPAASLLSRSATAGSQPLLGTGQRGPERRRRLPRRAARPRRRCRTRVTGVVQNGSLPVYAGVILATAAVLPAAALLVGVGLAGLAARSGRSGDAPDRRSRSSSRRSARPSCAGGSRPPCSSASPATRWPGCSSLSGAPDLALTQVAVETLSTVVFVLVLRRLPERFERQSTPRRRVVRLADRRARSARRCSCSPSSRAGDRLARRCPTRWSRGRCPTGTAATSST